MKSAKKTDQLLYEFDTEEICRSDPNCFAQSTIYKLSII
jgi:hypothetical protein